MSLETPLLSSIQLVNISENPTAKHVNERHQLFMDNGNSIPSDKLIAILGGTDAILKHYLSSDNLSPLTSHQLQEINGLLNTANDEQFNENPSVNETTNIESPVIFVLHKNSFLHQINSNIADKVSNFAFSSITAIVFVVSLLAATTIGWIIPEWFYNVYLWIFYVSLFLYGAIVLLLLNRTVTKLIIRTFEFWFKMSYLIRFIIGLLVFTMKCSGKSKTDKAFNVVHSIVMVVYMTSFCFLDGVKMPLKIKATVLVFFSLVVVYLAFENTVASYQPYYSCAIPIFGGYKLDAIEMTNVAWRIIAIFMCKQTFYSIFKQPKSSLISKPVKILWI